MAEASPRIPAWQEPGRTETLPSAWDEPLRLLKRHVFELAMPLVALSDALIVAATFLLVYQARFHWKLLSPAPAPTFKPYLHGSVLVAIAWTGAMALLGLYRVKRGASKFDDFVLMLTGVSLGAAVTLSLSFFYRSFSYSRLVYAYAFLGSLVVLGVWHALLRLWQGHAMSRGWGTLNTLILGSNSLASMVAGRIAGRSRLGRVLVGHVVLPGESPVEDLIAPVVGTDDDLPRLLEAHAIDDVIVAWPAGTPQQIFGLMQAVTLTRPVTVQLAPGMLELTTRHFEITSLDGLPVLGIRQVALRKWYNRAIKRAMDIAFAGLGLLVAALPMSAIALAVKLTSPGPVLYSQERLGRDGRLFKLYKFRSMPVAAEPDGPVWASQGDARATPVGALLRRYSLDELPQLWNVVIGDMTLVGPRPERPFFVDQFREKVPKYMDRHLVRSGITGWAQVNGLRGDVSIEERTRYDIHYVENWSVLLDLRIMLKTVLEIFRRPAY